jgi:hypothetical protein
MTPNHNKPHKAYVKRKTQSINEGSTTGSVKSQNMKTYYPPSYKAHKDKFPKI